MVWVTFGVYFFYWILELMKEINTLSDEVKFDVKKKLTNVILILVPYLIIFVIMEYTFRTPFFFILFCAEFILAVLWFVMIIKYIKQVCNGIALLEQEAQVEKKISGGRAILLFFLYFTAIPYIQSHMNKIIDSINNKQRSEGLVM